MTERKTSDRDVNRAIRSWLHEDRHEDVSRVAGAVLDQLETIPQRRATWPARRTPIMNKVLTYGLGAAAVVVLLVLGAQFLGSIGDTGTTPTPTFSPTAEPTAEPTAQPTGLPVGGSFTLTDEIPVYVTIPADGWAAMDNGVLAKNHDTGPPEGAFVITGWVGDPLIPGDPCHWASTMPDSPATTLDEIVSALGRQATRDASEPVDVSAGGHPGKSITLHVPDDPFADCDGGRFCTLSYGDGLACDMWFQLPGMIDELWIVDNDGEFVITSGSHFSGTPAQTIDELRTILASMTFAE